jgi:hypothetical protein
MTISAINRKLLFGINALSAWLGLGMSVVIETFGLVHPAATNATVPMSQFAHAGRYAEGIAGAPNRLMDLFSYFTIWSQVTVGVVLTLLFLNPSRDGKVLRIFRLDSLLMISVTGIVYNVMIGPKYPPVGLNVYSSFIEHTLTPLLTVIIFILVGPRRWINLKIYGLAILFPIAYVIYTLIRGAILGVYPYDFFDVAQYGYAAVLEFVGFILLASMVLMGLFWGIEKVFTGPGQFQADKQESSLL